MKAFPLPATSTEIPHRLRASPEDHLLGGSSPTAGSGNIPPDGTAAILVCSPMGTTRAHATALAVLGPPGSALSAFLPGHYVSPEAAP